MSESSVCIGITRREFINTSQAALVAAALGASACSRSPARPVVSVVRIQNGRIDYAVDQAIDLLGGIRSVTNGKNQIMLKPNLVAPGPTFTTKPQVIQALARLMKGARKEVLIGEGSAAAEGFNVKGKEMFRTRRGDLIDGMQQHVFRQLGYTDLSESLGVPLVNLHAANLVEVDLPGGFVHKKLTMHKSLTDIDLLCSVPMMKTHKIANVTLGMKNLIGLYPGTVYQAPRALLHDRNSELEPSGTAAAIVDMVRATRLGLVVVDGSMAMEGEGPSEGTLVKMDVIVAGTNPLATDMVAAAIMGFRPEEVPTFDWAQKAGMTPATLQEVEIRGEPIERVRRNFVKPQLMAWADIRKVWATKEI